MKKLLLLLYSIRSNGSCRSYANAVQPTLSSDYLWAQSVVCVMWQLFADFLLQSLCWRWGLQLFSPHDTRTHTGWGSSNVKFQSKRTRIQLRAPWPVIARHHSSVFSLSSERLRDVSGLCFFLLRVLSKHWRCFALSLLSGCEVFVTVATPTPSVMARRAYEATRVRTRVWRGIQSACLDADRAAW